jgi:hypothetical protein
MMRRHMTLMVLLVLIGMAWVPSCRAEPPGLVATQRVVLFEDWVNPGEAASEAASPHIERLMTEYAGRALFLEQRPGQGLGDRATRFWAATSSAAPKPPYICVDSGYRSTQGAQTNYYQAYKTLIDQALARPPQAVVTGTALWLGNAISATVVVSNTSQVDLSYALNRARVHLLVYEQDTGLTGALVQGARSQPITQPLLAGTSASYGLTVTGLTYADRTKLRCVALVDYRPGVATGPFDLLQAAALPLTVLPPRAYVPAIFRRYEVIKR